MLPPTTVKIRKESGEEDDPLLASRAAILQEALASWPRRGAPLLEVNCGEGEFLPLLWRCGFDVVATETEPELRKTAACRGLPGLELYAASDDSLPFDNDYFDWVIVHLYRKDSPDSDKNAIEEGLRVARRGLMVSFWNSASIAALFELRGRKPPFRSGYTWLHVYRRLYSLRAGSLASYAALYAPRMAWRNKTALAMTNYLAFLKIFGAWCLIRVDLNALNTATPIGLKIENKMRGNSPAFEYSHKNVDSDKKRP